MISQGQVASRYPEITYYSSSNFIFSNTFNHVLSYLPALTLSWAAWCALHSLNGPCTETLMQRVFPRFVQCTVCTTEHLPGLPLAD